MQQGEKCGESNIAIDWWVSLPSSHNWQHYILSSVQLLWLGLEILYSISCSDMYVIHSSRNVVTVHAINTYVGVEIYPFILNLNTRSWEVSFTLLPLYAWHSFNRRLDRPHSHLGCFGKEKTLLLLLKIETRFLSSPPHSLIFIPTMLNHLVKLLCQLYGL